MQTKEFLDATKTITTATKRHNKALQQIDEEYKHHFDCTWQHTATTVDAATTTSALKQEEQKYKLELGGSNRSWQLKKKYNNSSKRKALISAAAAALNPLTILAASTH